MLLSMWRRRTSIDKYPDLNVLPAVKLTNRVATKKGEGGVDEATEERIADALVAWRDLEQSVAPCKDAVCALGRLGWMEHAESMKQCVNQINQLLANFEAEANQRLGLKS